MQGERGQKPKGKRHTTLRYWAIRRAALIDDQSKRARIVDTSVTYTLTRMNQDQTYFIAPSAWTSTEWEEDVSVDESASAKVHIGGIDGANAKQDQRTREGILSYDDYGNVIYNKAWTHGGAIMEMAAVYEHRPADWLVSLLWTQNVVSYNEGEPAPKPRRIEHDYDPSRGLLCHTFIERNNADPSIPQVITYHRAEDGQVRAVTRSAAGLAHRTSHLEYDAAERIFPVSAWNDLGHISRAWVHPALGVPLVRQLGIEIPQGTSGAAKGLSPNGWTWHHVPDRPGVMQLVPRHQHTPWSGFYEIMHPDGRGGFFKWGAEY